MNQNIWGPTLWFSLHTITFQYDINPSPEKQREYRQFLEGLQYVVPCSVCKKNYVRHLKEMPIDNALKSRKALVYWMIDLHNTVNGETGKKILTYDNVIKKYEKIYNKKIILDNKTNNNEIVEHSYSQRNYNMVFYILSVYIIILIIAYLCKIFLSKNCKK